MTTTIALAGKWLAANPVALAFATAVLGAVLVPLVVVAWRTAVWGFSTIYGAWTRWRDQARVIRITTLGSSHFDKFIEIYHAAFREYERVSTEEIECWLEGKSDAAVDYSILLALKSQVPVGFAISLLGRLENIQFIPYFAVRGLGREWTESRKVINMIYSAATRYTPRGVRIVVEVEDPGETGILPNEITRRRARIKRLKAVTHAISLRMMRVATEYRCPSFETDAERSDDRVLLLFLIGKEELGSMLQKEEVMRIIEFVYRKVYLTCHQPGLLSRHEYEEKLVLEIERQNRILSEQVPLLPL